MSIHHIELNNSFGSGQLLYTEAKAYNHLFEPIEDLNCLPTKWDTVPKLVKVACAVFTALGLTVLTVLGLNPQVSSDTFHAALTTSPILLLTFIGAIAPINDYEDERECGIYRKENRSLNLSQILANHSVTAIHQYKLLPACEIIEMDRLISDRSEKCSQKAAKLRNINDYYKEQIEPHLKDLQESKNVAEYYKTLSEDTAETVNHSLRRQIADQIMDRAELQFNHEVAGFKQARDDHENYIYEQYYLPAMEAFELSRLERNYQADIAPYIKKRDHTFHDAFNIANSQEYLHKGNLALKQMSEEIMIDAQKYFDQCTEQLRADKEFNIAELDTVYAPLISNEAFNKAFDNCRVILAS